MSGSRDLRPDGACERLDDCAPGLVCNMRNTGDRCPEGSPGCCAPLCDPDARDCEDGQICEPITNGLGVCVDA